MNTQRSAVSRQRSAACGVACLILAANFLLACGCQSSVRQVSRTANVIRDTARSSEMRFGVIEREITGMSPDSARITAEAVAGAFEQRQIQNLVGGLQETLTATQDRSSPWFGVLNLWGWISLMVLGIVVLGYFGVMPVIRKWTKRMTT